MSKLLLMELGDTPAYRKVKSDLNGPILFQRSPGEVMMRMRMWWYDNPIYLSLQCYHVRARKKISEDERIGEQEVEIWKEFFRQMLYQRMKMMEEEEMMLEVTQELFTKGWRDHHKMVERTDEYNCFLMYVYEQASSHLLMKITAVLPREST